MQNISVIIIAKNEAKNIAECISSVKWAEEIIVVDAESTDETIETAKKFTDKVYIKKWEGYVPQKKYALSLAKNQWVLSIDADERVTDELKTEIEHLIDNSVDGYKIQRRNFLFNKEIKSCGWGTDYQLRLFKKDKTSLTDRLVHEAFIANGKIEKLRQPILHYTFSTFADFFAKINRYTTLRAQELFEEKRKVNGWIIISRSIIAFFQFYIFKRGYKDGIHGLIISLLHSISTLLNYVKLWELNIKNKS
ncbi:MAG: glycosyltransferase family 2 protein [Ignavibacteria bacterium]|nr:glycosyltransferase family 2 protein [Ignavibacteria bacterium]MBT8383430.1 glycosyltransferase family 2 protein [Ignavibacteria bacterium]MBT8390725.1 glycosyltransferase family 2 protein [Ignavibacteria bacterium]NNJ52676.1 glycosyltransferase family 2 protein [Ignavibacteriaceae bacterium]NNL22528.1 glycosyltransferase family 2 protein [Ignavibacteriaceae bacterium]